VQYLPRPGHHPGIEYETETVGATTNNWAINQHSGRARIVCSCDGDRVGEWVDRAEVIDVLTASCATAVR
jgi:hypothetical protein